ncbi:MAG: hypothetical protein MUQ56_01035, partial [Thermoleophilia bacterium]|nr:hypothetical protein [Thermoleophilia bacterium]
VGFGDEFGGGRSHDIPPFSCPWQRVWDVGRSEAGGLNAWGDSEAPERRHLESAEGPGKGGARGMSLPELGVVAPVL